MKLSAKGRYGLAAMTWLAQNYEAGTPVTIISISEKLGISKIYLEQVFSLLKRARLVHSLKGAQGGYELASPPQKITAYDILSAIELALIEKTQTTADKVPELDRALHTCVYDHLDTAIANTLQKVTLTDILTETERQKSSDNLMYFI